MIGWSVGWSVGRSISLLVSWSVGHSLDWLLGREGARKRVERIEGGKKGRWEERKGDR